MVTFFYFNRIIIMKKNNTNNRSNDFENYVMSIIKSRDNNCIVHEKLSLVAMQVIKDSNKGSILFTDAGSNYYNITGSQKGTEFVYHYPLNNIDIRIECKSRKTINLLGEIIISLNYVANMSEKLFCLVLSDVLMNDYVLDLIKTTIKEKKLINKVWFGSAGDFDAFLAKNLHN